MYVLEYTHIWGWSFNVNNDTQWNTLLKLVEKLFGCKKEEILDEQDCLNPEDLDPKKTNARNWIIKNYLEETDRTSLISGFSIKGDNSTDNVFIGYDLDPEHKLTTEVWEDEEGNDLDEPYATFQDTSLELLEKAKKIVFDKLSGDWIDELEYPTLIKECWFHHI